MNVEQWQKVKRLFAEAADLHAAQRQALLRDACAGDDALRMEVEALLAAADRQSTATAAQTPGPTAGADARRGDGSACAGAVVGPYKLLQLIGEGGMGEVWRAEQLHPIKRAVAVKLIKLGMDSRAVIARFEQERQALALMNHPNVARVLDAGTRDDGRPYFVMEYVPGEAITAFCDRHNYTTEQRLALFVQACEAVQHAHQKAIIHRDLKPANILVMLQDGQPIVKVIDFGIAKATAQKLTERTLFTEAGQLVGTPEYMSPEQAEMSALDIDTRTDIYSLGVVDGAADVEKQQQAGRRRQLVAIAVVGDRDAGDVLHREVRPAFGRDAGVEHRGDVRMVHQCQRLPLGLEPRHHLTRVHAGLDHLHGDAPPRGLLLGEVDLAHAALAEEAQDPVRADGVRVEGSRARTDDGRRCIVGWGALHGAPILRQRGLASTANPSRRDPGRGLLIHS